MSTDSLLVRREARRRKILENSENRLKRITGKDDTEKTETTTHLEENGFVSFSGNFISNGSVKQQQETVPCSIPPRAWVEESYNESSISEQFEFLSSTSGLIENDKHSASYLPSNLVYISMAILFRLSIELDSHFICANNLVIAFLLTKLAVCSFFGLPIPETSRFLGSLLLLSGISSQKIKIFTLLISVVYTGLHEFALCIFVFVFCDLLVNFYKTIFYE
ncbi:uncharacterized protein LOC128990970 [Macrosteles quadrilineatus]|uniref:uncharacterized protein LOC128990970 n=1 Tax=Macrosteles quadrilineatus TaxID=74068 RepID=UPI0023E1E6EB|nr:uncharacterized protein LOC128990970 [Macrosteles quadrilineatus]